MAKTATTDTPLMQQHRAIKQKYPDAILLFRVGDFYETFGQDAIIASRVLGITLTKRNNGAAAAAELAGFPHHSLDSYLHKLVKAGHRVAVCDQLEDPKQAKGIVKRGVTEMVTPGTALGDKLLEQRHNNFLASIVAVAAEHYGLAFLDISTGELMVAQGDRSYADKLLQSFAPAEIICPRKQLNGLKEDFNIRVYTYTLDEWVFDDTYCSELLLKHFQTHSLKGFGVEDLPGALQAAGSLFHYLRETDHPHLDHITRLVRIDRQQFLWMDRFTIRNLELVQGSGPDHPTLLSVLDNTSTPMGARLLKRWIIFPLVDKEAIHRRLHTVTYIKDDPTVSAVLSQQLPHCGDIERLSARLTLKKTTPRELRQLATGLRATEQIRLLGHDHRQEPFLSMLLPIDACVSLAEKIERTLVEAPPAQPQKGGLIATGVHDELDELRQLAHHGKAYLTDLQQREQQQTGIASLKIGFNNVYGYYLEVTHAHKDKVPPGWIRRQTLTNAERYITPELKEYEEKILGAEEKIMAIELRLFEQLVDEAAPFVPVLQKTAAALAILDCLHCFAGNSQRYDYCLPQLLEEGAWQVTNGRHPVIERSLPAGESYVGNDLLLDKDQQQVIILTGPNMSGKSALLRQTALITIMAHIGHYVPADAAQIPLTDRIFTRVGASDNLAAGESTFMVEMNETAAIINNLSDRSLVLLDEIGRGTSTYDGISIAWSIAEYLHNWPGRPKTLFATHYHELNDLETQLPRVRNYHITNREVGNKILFLRKLAPGGTTHSFGIHVARMAGMPHPLVARAQELLARLESERGAASNGQAPSASADRTDPPQVQLSIFDSHSETFQEIRDLLTQADIDRLTPVEALLKLKEIKDRLK